MQNQPFAQIDIASPQPRESSDSAQRRILLLQIAVPILLLLIGIRVVYLQAMISERFITPWRMTRDVETTLPARTGRILARDGTVLAYDESRYDIALDYRWLETPLDRQWLKKQVYSRLSDAERNDPEKKRAVESEISFQQAQLFESLAQLVGDDAKQTRARAAAIQQKIEHMLAAVESRREQTLLADSPKQLHWRDGVRGIARTIQAELTTPPRRYADDPIILKEELEPHVLFEDVPLSVVARIHSTPHAFPGVHVIDQSTRVYPMDDVAAHLLGVRKRKGIYGETTSAGGIEQAFNETLSGRLGKIRETVNRQGEVIETQIVQTPEDGEDVRLTIDSQLQMTAERLLDQALAEPTSESAPTPRGGVVIVMDLWNGDLLIAAASPRIGPKRLMNPTAEEWEELLQLSNQPFFPRATQMAIPAGSIFKIVTAAAALEAGITDDHESFFCEGFLHQPDRHRCQIFTQFGQGHGHLGLRDAICQSCNVYFFHLAEQLGPAPLVKWGRRFGFGEKTGVDLPGESAGHLTQIQSGGGSRSRSNSQALQLSIGQGDLLVTPLQVARMMAAIGNGGYLVTPHVAVSDNSTQKKLPLTKIEELGSETIETIQRGMEMVVDHPLGTGTAALTPAMTLAAKTGTAQNGSGPDHAWLAGYAPADSPRVAFVVVLEHGGSGGQAAGPIVRELMTEMLGLGYLQPRWDETRRKSRQPSLSYTQSPQIDTPTAD